MSISAQEILMVVGGASTIATSLFWGAVYLGRLTSRIERVEERIARHAEILDTHERLLRAAALKP